MYEHITPIEPRVLPASEQLDIVVIGAGLGGLGAAISLQLAGHNVTVLESASQIGEIGAGIQILSNSSRVLIQWGLYEYMQSQATFPTKVNMLGWKGNHITDMDFADEEKTYKGPFWDFHRADLHRGLLERSKELGAKILVNSRVADIECPEEAEARTTVILGNGQRHSADMVIAADGLHSRCREILLGRPSPPIPTGDLAYRVLLKTDDMTDPELREFLHPHEVRYWMGPGAHAVTYPLRQGTLLNMVLLVPDDMPANAMTIDGNIEEMSDLFKDWDPRIPKLLQFCKSVQKWKLCYRPGIESSWYNDNGTLVLLGDAVHATLPYLASGAGMSLEDAAALGLCLTKVTKSSTAAEKMYALSVYEKCRRKRTEAIVDRGNLQQVLYHLPDGEEQAERDRLLRYYGRDGTQLRADSPHGDMDDGKDPLPWRRHGVGSWLLSYDVFDDVNKNWGTL